MSAFNNLPKSILTPKYIVSKIDKDEVLNPDDYFVLRRQDLLAAPALWAYVNTLRTAYDTLSFIGYPGPEPLLLAEQANQAALLAKHWDQTDIPEVKLPD